MISVRCRARLIIACFGQGQRPGNPELIPLRVGEYDPARIALADVDAPSTQVEQATDLVVLLPVGRVRVEVNPVLDGLALGHGRECQHRRRKRAGAVPAFRNQPGSRDDDALFFVLRLVVEDRTPEPGEAVRFSQWIASW